MATTTLVSGIGLALLVAVGVGWVWGASGRSQSHRALQIAELRAVRPPKAAAKLMALLNRYSAKGRTD